jgi:GAF domain-containing protein
MPQHDDTPEGMADLSRILLTEESLESILSKVATLAGREIAGSDAVSVTLVEDGRARTAASTADLAVEVDRLQYAAGEGPCLDAARQHVVRLVTDMATDSTWPHYGPAAAAAGVGSSLSVPLPVRDTVLGALNIYSCERGSFDDVDLERASTLAAHAAVAVANAHAYNTTVQLAAHLRVALETRGVIEQAKGILMQRHRCTADDAFELLRAASQNENVKLRDVAGRIVAELDGGRGSSAGAD